MNEEKNLLNNFETLPTGNPLLALYTFMGSANDLEAFANNWGDASVKPGEITIGLKGYAQMTVTYAESKLPKSKRSKLENYFTFLMCKIADTAIANGVLTQDKISFKVQELVNAGIFTDYRNAKRAVDEMGDFIGSVRVKFQSSYRVYSTTPIYRIDRIKGDVKVSIDKDTDWGKLTKQFLPIPKEMHTLSPQGLRLMSIVYEWLRINAKRCGSEMYEIPLEEIVRRIAADFQDGNTSRRTFVRYIEQPVNEINEKCRSLYIKLKLSLPAIKDTKTQISQGTLRVYPQLLLSEKLEQIKNGNMRKAAMSGKL